MAPQSTTDLFDGATITLIQDTPSQWAEGAPIDCTTNVAASHAAYWEQYRAAVAEAYPSATVVLDTPWRQHSRPGDIDVELASGDEWSQAAEDERAEIHRIGETVYERGEFWVEVAPLRERGVYAFVHRGETVHVVATAGDQGGYVLYTPAEWIDGSQADWEIAAGGDLRFQGDPWIVGLRIEDLEDTGFDAGDDDEFRGQVGTRPSMGTDWPVIAVVRRCEPGQTDQGEPVAWWVTTLCNGAYDGEGGGVDTFAEAVAWAVETE